MYCKQCGSQVPDNTKFCPFCGTVVSEQPTDGTPAANVGQPNRGWEYSPNSYQPPIYQQPPRPVENPGKGLGIASLVLGIIGCLLFAFPFYLGFFCFAASVVGIVLAAVSMKKSKAVGASTGLAVAGLVVSICGVVVAFVALCIVIVAVGFAGILSEILYGMYR